MRSLIIFLFLLTSKVGVCQLYPVIIKNESGAISQTGFIDEDGEKEGEWVSYGPTNVIRGVGYYKDDKKVGTWKTFKDDGLIWSEMIYSDGKKVCGRIFDDNGKILEERRF